MVYYCFNHISVNPLLKHASVCMISVKVRVDGSRAMLEPTTFTTPIVKASAMARLKWVITKKTEFRFKAWNQHWTSFLLTWLRYIIKILYQINKDIVWTFTPETLRCLCVPLPFWWPPKCLLSPHFGRSQSDSRFDLVPFKGQALAIWSGWIP